MSQKLTIKSFLNKANKTVLSPAKFLASHRDSLVEGDFSKYSAPFIIELENGHSTPSDALSELCKALFVVMQRAEIEKAELSLSKSNFQSKTGHGLTSDFIATVYDLEGKVVSVENAKGELVDLIKGFDNPSDAGNWIKRRLFDCSPSCHGEVVHSKMLINGTPLTTKISSVEAVTSILRPTIHKVVTTRGPSLSAPLKSRMRIRMGKTAHFSRG